MKTTSVLLLMVGVALPVAFANCPATFVVLSGSCLKIVENPPGAVTSPRLSWQEARNKCKEMGADLAVIGNEALLRHVSSHMIKHFPDLFYWSTWVGGLRQNGIWKWLNGDRISVTSPMWMPNNPSNDSEDVHVRLVAGANDVLRLNQAQEAIGYICEVR
ncbi:asialoglycoprotein receptor 1-like [Panulirus ornatus]|uniref:asialoglycoprotein receptor 1-like n=1 Tax=Panulirus ornatus TaxID=150431 RepID=UPI003A862A97